VRVKDISNRFHINPKYLSTIFKSEKGQSLAQWVIDQKIQKACKLLIAPDENPISEIARRLGYHDARYFSRLFKKKMGLTPTDYRKKHLYRTNVSKPEIAARHYFHSGCASRQCQCSNSIRLQLETLCSVAKETTLESAMRFSGV